MHVRSQRRSFFALILLLAVFLSVASRQAFAHAVLLSSTPQKNGSVSGPDLSISLRYNSRVDGGRSSLSLLKPDGTVERIDGLTQPKPDSVAGTGHGLAKGSYVLRWQVL